MKWGARKHHRRWLELTRVQDGGSSDMWRARQRIHHCEGRRRLSPWKQRGMRTQPSHGFPWKWFYRIIFGMSGFCKTPETLKETSWAKDGARKRVLEGCHVCKGRTKLGSSSHAFIHAVFLPFSPNGNVTLKLLANYKYKL